jgi:hypothetical protein
MAPNDRDKLKNIPPPAGVRAQTAKPLEEDFEGLTPVEGDPVSQMTKRGAQAAASSRAAFGAIGDLRRELRASVERDVRDHEAMTHAIHRIERAQQAMNDQVTSLNGHVGDLREDMGAVRTWVEDERRRRAESDRMRALVAVEEKKVELEVRKAGELSEIKIEETAKVTKIADEADSRKVRRKRNLKMIGILAAIVTALSGLVGALQC